MAWQSFMRSSRGNYGYEVPSGGDSPASLEQLKFGCLQRIADSFERMEQKLDRMDGRLVCLGRTLDSVLALQRRETRRAMKRQALAKARRELV